jgi:predicted nucleic acid-binding protein
MLVVDASVAVPASLFRDGFVRLRDNELVAPPLMWSEARSALHEALWRRELPAQDALAALERLKAAPVSPSQPAELGAEAWRIADSLGWAKIYDAEYVALAKLLGCRLVTADGRLVRATKRLGFVTALTDL